MVSTEDWQLKDGYYLQWVQDKECIHHWEWFNSVQICIYCSIEKDFMTDSTLSRNEKGPVLGKIWSRQHDRKRWNNITLMYFNGFNYDLLSLQGWYIIVSETPNPFKWYDVFKVFQKQLKWTEIWLTFGWYIDKPVELTKISIIMANKFTNCFKEKYRFNWIYMLYKFVQIYDNKSTCLIPLKLTKACLIKTDKAWKIVCKEHDLIYMDSVIYSITFDKERILKTILEGMKINNIHPLF